MSSRKENNWDSHTWQAGKRNGTATLENTGPFLIKSHIQELYMEDGLSTKGKQEVWGNVE